MVTDAPSTRLRSQDGRFLSIPKLIATDCALYRNLQSIWWVIYFIFIFVKEQWPRPRLCPPISRDYSPRARLSSVSFMNWLHQSSTEWGNRKMRGSYATPGRPEDSSIPSAIVTPQRQTILENTRGDCVHLLLISEERWR